MTAPLSVTIGARDISALIDTLTFSNVDPGGYEAATITFRAPISAPRHGETVRVFCGLDVAWWGTVNDAGNLNRDQAIVESVQAVGPGAALKRNPYREIYVGRSLSRWKAMSVAREQAHTVTGYSPRGGSVYPDSDEPALLFEIDHSWVVGELPLVEMHFEVSDIPIGSIYYEWSKNTNINAADANWQWLVLLSNDDQFSLSQNTGNLRAAGPGTGTLTSTSAGNRTVAAVQLAYNTAAGGGLKYTLYWDRLAVFGEHGLTKRGAAPQGFYPSDIAGHALAKANTLAGVTLLDTGVIETASGYTVPDYVLESPTLPEKVIDDMANLVGWHWGVWAPNGLDSNRPALHFRARPPAATCSVTRGECDTFDAPRIRLDQLYDRAQITWQDSFGETRVATVTLANPLLELAGTGASTLQVALGQGTEAAAQALGNFALSLAQAAARGAGSASIPDTVRTPQGRKPACLLRAGLDRLQVIDMPDAGPIHESDTRRYDNFRVRRVETTVTTGGKPQTRVEFDGGADLLEVLQARLAVAAGVSG